MNLKKQLFPFSMKINKEWHLKNRIPENPTFKERVKWHLEHQKNCNCRPIPRILLEEMKKNGLLNILLIGFTETENVGALLADFFQL